MGPLPVSAEAQTERWHARPFSMHFASIYLFICFHCLLPSQQPHPDRDRNHDDDDEAPVAIDWRPPSPPIGSKGGSVLSSNRLTGQETAACSPSARHASLHHQIRQAQIKCRGAGQADRPHSSFSDTCNFWKTNSLMMPLVVSHARFFFTRAIVMRAVCANFSDQKSKKSDLSKFRVFLSAPLHLNFKVTVTPGK